MNPTEHNPLLRRVIENEVDVKSVFNRVHANGMNPYGSLDVLEILKELNNDRVSEDPYHDIKSYEHHGAGTHGYDQGYRREDQPK